MLRFRCFAVLLLAPALALLGVGCGGGDKGKDQPKPAAKSGGEGGGAGAKSASSAASATPVEAKGVATLKGRVTYDGNPPPREEIKIPDDNKDKDYCHKGDTKEQKWLVGPDKGVANVVVFIRAPEGHYFKIPADQQKAEDVIIDQPFCAFIPHVRAMFPSFYDPETKKQKKTNQVLRFKNSAEINHNTAVEGRKLVNDSKNEILPAKKGELVYNAKAGRDTDVAPEDLLKVNCDIHKWMNARIAVFSNPYHDVTKEDGSYEIKGAPAGAEVITCYWHESMGDSLKDAKTEKLTLKDGDNTQDFKVKQ